MNNSNLRPAQVLVIAAVLSATGFADAQSAEPKADRPAGGDDEAARAGATPPDPAGPAIDQPPIGSEEKRPVPDYDGRGDDPVTAGQVALWIPRGLFAPLYLVSEYVIRWPLGKITSALEEHDVVGVLTEFFTFGPDGKSGLVPSGLIDFGFRPSIGLYFFSDDLITDGLGFRAHGAFGGVDWYRATGTVRYTLAEETPHSSEQTVQIKGIYSHRPDWLFYGLGPESLDDERSRFTAQYVDADLSFRSGFWRSSRLVANFGVRDALFKNVGCCDQPVIRDAVAAGYYELPPLYDDGFLVAHVGLDLSLDTRKRRFAFEGEATDFVSPPGTGLKLAGRAEITGGLRDTEATATSVDQRLGYITYGGTLGGYLDLYKHRVVGLQLMVDFVDPMQEDGQIPFTELVSLGGARPMRGFLDNRVLDRSSAVAQLEYRWPIWVSLDGSAHYALGNVFGEHLDGFETSLLRQSFGLGFRATGSRDHAFEFLLAAGTETFDQGSSVDTVRFVFGASEGF